MYLSFDSQQILVKSITENNGDLTKQLFKANPCLERDLSLSDVTREAVQALSQVKSQYPLMNSAYIPDNAWCLAGVFNAHHVLQAMREFGVRISASNSYGNNILHCIIARASIETNKVESKSITTISFIKSFTTTKEYTELLLAENSDGLRPLELASHLGTFSLFKFIFETSELYVSRTKDLSLFTVLYFDITDYVTGSRMFKSPPFTLVLLDQNNMNHKSLHDMFFKDPMKTWLAAINYSNRPYIVFFALLRTTYIFNFLLSLHFTKARVLASKTPQLQPMHHEMSSNLSTPLSTTNNETEDTEDARLFISVMFSTAYSIGALLINIAYGIIVMCHDGKVTWKTKKATGNKNLVMYKWFYASANWIILIGILVISQDVLRLIYIQQHQRTFSADHIDVIVIIAVCVCIWDLMYYLQLVPGLNLYTIAVQRMLTGFASFGVIFGLFFFSYVFGFHVLFDDTETFLASLYRTFHIMLGAFNFADTNHSQHFLHFAFIFMIVYLLLNILIAIFTSSYDWVYKHRRIILTIQCLSVYLIMESVMVRIMSRFHNYLRKKYLHFENDRVYVTKVVIKEFKYNKSNTLLKTKSDMNTITEVTIIWVPT